MTIKKTTSESRKLKSSLSVSDSGKKKAGMFSDLSKPAEPTTLPMDCPVTLEKKNQNMSPEVANKG